MKTPGVYRESVKAYRQESARRLQKTLVCLSAFKDATTTYAREIAALAELHGRVAKIWRDATDDLHEAAQKARE